MRVHALLHEGVRRPRGTVRNALVVLLLALCTSVGGEDEPELMLDEVVADGSGSGIAADSVPPLDREPELVEHCQADFPVEVQRLGVEGSVVLDLLVSDSGTVDSIAVVQGLHPALDSSATAAARRFRFRPALADSQPVAVILQYAFRFSLNEVVERIESYVNFTGVVLERGTRVPVADAMVVLRFLDTLADTSVTVPFSVYLARLGRMPGQYVEEGRLVTVSDSLGRFRFSNLPAGPIEVTVPVPGYEEFYTNEHLAPAESLSVVYYLRKASYGDYEIVVYGKTEEKEVSRQQLTLTEIKKIPGVGNDAVKVVQALPGVARPTLGMSAIVVRGAPTSNSLFLVDGVEIPQGMLFHFGGITSTYNAEALERIDFYPGGFGTRYGGVLGGVVELTGRKPKTDRWHVSAGADFVDGALYAEGPIGRRVSVLGQARRSFIGNIISFAAEQVPNTNILTVAPFYWDYLVRADVDVSKHQHAYLTLWGVKDATELVSSQIRGGSSDVDKATDRLRVESLFHLGIVGHDWNLSDVVHNSFRYSLAYVEATSSFFGIFKTNLNYWQNYLRDQLTIGRSERLKVKVGADLQWAPVNLTLAIPYKNNQVAFDTTDGDLYGVVGAYLNLEWRPWKSVLVMPGIRYDYFPELKHDGALLPEFWNYSFDNTTPWSAEPSARLMVRWEYYARQAIKLAMGNYSQTPQPIVQSIHPRWGDPTLSAAKAAHYVLGWEWKLTDLWSASVEGYINRQWDVARPQNVVGGAPFNDNGRRRMQGMEVMLRHELGDSPFFGWLAYSLSKSQYYDYEERRWARMDKDQTHNLIAIAYLGLPKGWGVGMRLQYTTGDPITPQRGVEYYEPGGFYNVIYGPSNAHRLPPTFQIDLRIDKRFVFRRWTMTAYVNFLNINYFLYESPQAVVPNFSYPYNPETDTWYNTIVPMYSLPSFGLKAEF